MALRINLVDDPSCKRKTHIVSKPLVEGIGIILAVSFSCILVMSLSGLRGFFAGMITLIIIGFLDDFKDLNPYWKFMGQIFATIFMIYFSKVILLSFGDIFACSPINLGIFAFPITIFCTVGVINAINMIDGLDGLAGGVSLVGLISLSILAYINNQTEIMLLGIAVSGAVSGFLKYNWYPARLFMGDTGSLFLGFAIAFLSIAVLQSDNNYISPVAPLLIIIVPVVDTITVMIKRVLKGKNPFVADKYHLHHVIVRLGLDKKLAVKVIICISIFFSFLAIIGTIIKIPDYYMFSIFLVYFTLYLTTSFYIKNILKFKLKLIRGLNRIF
ncbi:MAG: undecaprenyl/decaprenyl-phosphate alpha-N-acetylglucosaminyl 1-phosphate transferase [Planctomycetes bacterium]|nr:undecaprenyl/decaprenyl-phosphate alpha-N-acetylglucosaminyl 1-phosphate transferase [Planctomycetota bacterium]